MILKTYPKAFDERTVYRYAILPTVIEDKLIWLESYYCTQFWGQKYHSDKTKQANPNNKNNRWITKKRWQ